MNFPHPKLQIFCFAILLAFASLAVNAQDTMERGRILISLNPRSSLRMLRMFRWKI